MDLRHQQVRIHEIGARLQRLAAAALRLLDLSGRQQAHRQLEQLAGLHSFGWKSPASAAPGSGARMNASPTRNASTPRPRMRATSAVERIPLSVITMRSFGT